MKRVACAVVTAALFAAGTAGAEPTAADKETARSLMDEADKKFEARDFAAALKGYGAADALINVPTTAIEVARAQAALGQLVEARETTLRIGRMPRAGKEPAAFTKARADADALANDLAARIPSIRITVEGAKGGVPTVTVDGGEVPAAALGLPRKIDPGTHVVTASAPGLTPVRQAIIVGERQEIPVVLSFGGANASLGSATIPPPAGDVAPASSRSIVPWVAFGVGAVGLGIGVVTGALSLSKASSAKALCPTDTTCKPAAQRDIDASKTFALGSDIGFGVAIAGAAVGVVTLLVLKPHPASSSAAALFVAPSPSGVSAGLHGAF